MKTKFIFCLTLLALISFSASAQTEKGHYLLGGSFSAQFTSPTYISLSPMVAFFIQNNFALGGMLEVTSWGNGGGTEYSLGPVARYYFNTGNDKIKPFLQGFLGLGGYSRSGYSTTGLNGSVGGGVAFFLNEHVAIEPDLRLGFDTREHYTSPTFGMNVGIQVYLP